MDEVSTLVYDFFTNQSAFTDEVGTKLYPLVAREDSQYPFVIYTIGNPEAFTKEASNYPITLNLYYQPANYTECVTFAETVKTLVDVNTNWNLSDTSIDFIEDDQSIVATINFEIIN